ncbi:cationic amino acid transporter 4-like [Tachypleus tridentatus]|uniref:cationic amino acid transporter 4-like n=1 Tax=Tachypleus tridentatus TaxID=6853 RepID=UPI003FD49B91
MAFGDFVVIGQVSATVAGPGIIPSLLIALVASLLSGLCITEFITSQSQQANNLFTYAYQSVGELAAFLIGWISVLQHLVALAAVCRVQSAIINFLTGMSVHRFFKQVLGRVVVLDTVPDILALGLVLAPAVVVALGLRHSRWMGCFLVTSSTLTAMFFVVIGSLHSDVRNWTESGGFLTKGPGGVHHTPSSVRRQYLSSACFNNQISQNSTDVVFGDMTRMSLYDFPAACGM